MLFSIGDPGRAALELPAGAPGARIGSADVEMSAASLPGMRILAATSRGLQHRANETPRQDAFALGRCRAVSGSGRLITVVCDGVGALGRSDDAAVFVSRRLASLGTEGVPWPDAFARANEELRKVAEEVLVAANEGMATTAVAVAVDREADEWIGEAAWVGDSTLWHLSRDGRWQLIAGPPDADSETDYHSTRISSLPSAEAVCQSRQFRINGGTLFAMTDGIANPLKWSHDVQEALADWWMQPPDPFTFAAQVGFARKSHLDDRTVVGIWPDEG
jgi:Protein phosphatase 2C